MVKCDWCATNEATHEAECPDCGKYALEVCAACYASAVKGLPAECPECEDAA